MIPSDTQKCYHDFFIENDALTIVYQLPKKPHPNGDALSIMRRIENVVQRSSISWKEIQELTKIADIVSANYQKKHQRIQPSDPMMPLIVQHPSPRILALINQTYKNIFDMCRAMEANIQHAHTWGCKSADPLIATSYMTEFKKGIQELITLRKLPSKYIVSGSIEATLHNLRTHRAELQPYLNPLLLYFSKTLHYNGALLIKTLLMLGGNPNTQDQDSKTPLLYAKQANRIDIVSVLFAYGAFVVGESYCAPSPHEAKESHKTKVLLPKKST